MYVVIVMDKDRNRDFYPVGVFDYVLGVCDTFEEAEGRVYNEMGRQRDVYGIALDDIYEIHGMDDGRYVCMKRIEVEDTTPKE